MNSNIVTIHPQSTFQVARQKFQEMDAPMYYPAQECHRMQLLRTTLPICLDKTFEQFSYAAFCSCFDDKVTPSNTSASFRFAYLVYSCRHQNKESRPL